MNRFTFKLFAKTDQLFQLRLLDHEGRLLGERQLTDEVQAFAREVEAGYQRDHFQHPHLLDLGRRLYEWLNGPEQWLAGVNQGAAGAVVYVDVGEQLRHLPWELLAAPAGNFIC